MKFSSYIITDTGISLGDEGKGRLIYELYNDVKQKLKLVVKVNGGANSGHTINGFKLNLLPSSMVIPQIPLNALGAGVVADPRKILWEKVYLESNGFEVSTRLVIDEKCQVSDLCHRLLDLGWESYRKNVLNQPPRGTTARGISPTYIDEVNQCQIFYYEFLNSKEEFIEKFTLRTQRALDTLQHVCKMTSKEWDEAFEFLTNAEFKAHDSLVQDEKLQRTELDFTRFKGASPFELNIKLLAETYWNAGQELKHLIVDLRDIVLQTINAKNYVLGEFGQSYWLDKRFGFSPNVSASHTFTSEFFNSCNIPVQNIHNIGVMKAYDTGVGSHYMPTEFALDCPLGNSLRMIEFGTTTGRQRSVGWLDVPTKASVIRYGGVNDLMINKLDVLSTSELKHLKLCVGYYDPITGNEVFDISRNYAIRKRLLPIYINISTWEDSLRDVKSFYNLPFNAQLYISAIVYHLYKISTKNFTEYLDFPQIKYLGVGPDPKEIIKDVPHYRTLLKFYKTHYDAQHI